MNPFAYNFGGTIYDKVEDPEKDIFKSIMTQRKAKYTKGHDGVFNPQNLDEKKIMWHTFFHQDWTPQPAVRMIDAFEALSEGGATGEGGSGDGKTDKPTDGGDTKPGNPTGGEGGNESGDKPNENGGDSTNPETPTPNNPADGNDTKPSNPTESGTTNEGGNSDNKETEAPGDGGKADEGKPDDSGKQGGEPTDGNKNDNPAHPNGDEKP